MCAQCMMGAATAATAATGMRSYLATRAWSWLTAPRLQRISAVLVGGGVLTAGLLVSGSG